jgi:hypothetical protein
MRPQRYRLGIVAPAWFVDEHGRVCGQERAAIFASLSEAETFSRGLPFPVEFSPYTEADAGRTPALETQ